MAKVFDANIPPSLAARYWQVVHVDINSTDWWKKAGIAPNARNPIPVDPRGKLVKTAEEIAEWITNKYFGVVKNSAWRDYRWLRREEIIAGVFDAAQWYEMIPYGQTVGMAVPNCSIYTGSVNPNYSDAAKLPSFCRDYNVSSEYDIALATGVQPSPFPGWAGSVVGGRFVDEYAAISRVSFATPAAALTDVLRPSVVVVDVAFEVTAEKEGNNYWAGVDLSIAPRFPPNYYSMLGRKVITHRKDRFKQVVSVPPASSPFSWSFSRRLVVPLSWMRVNGNWLNYRYWDLYLSSMPSLGVFFALNQYVKVEFGVSARFYVAK